MILDKVVELLFSQFLNLWYSCTLLDCFLFNTSGYNLWNHKIAKETYVNMISKFLYKNFFKNIFSKTPVWVKSSRIHQMSVCETLLRLSIFENAIFREYAWKFFENTWLWCFRNFSLNKFYRELLFREHKSENFRNVSCWMFAKKMPMCTFSISSLSRTHFVNFFENLHHGHLRNFSLYLFFFANSVRDFFSRM